MIGDWCRFDADEREVKAFWADRELQWNGAGDSYYRSCGSRRWSAHQRTRSPPPTHKYPHSPPSSSLRTHCHPSFPSLPSSSSSQTHRHHSLSFPPPPSSPKNHPHHDFSNHHYQQNYRSTRLSTSTVSKRPTTNTQISQRTQNSDFRFHKAPKPFVESDRHNTRNPGSTRTLDLTMKLHDAEYSSNASGNLSSQRLSGLASNSELTENGHASGNKIFSGLSEKRRSFDSMEKRTNRDSLEYHRVGGDTIFSGLTEKYRASKKSPENLHDISDLTGKHRHSGGGGCSCSSGTMSTCCKLDPLPASKLAVPHKREEAEENDKLFSGQILNPYCEHSKTKSNCEKPNYFHNSKPTLPQNQPITLSNMMQFVAEWFEFEENKSVAEDTLIGNELSVSRASLKPLIGDLDERKCDDEVMEKQTVAFENVEKRVVKELEQEMDKHDLCTPGLKQDCDALVTLDCDTNCDEFTSFGHEEQPDAEGYENVEKELVVMDYGSTVEKANSKIDFGLFETHEHVGDSTKLDLLLEGPRRTKFGFGNVQETLAFEDQAIVSPTNFENLVATGMENAWLFTFAASDSIGSLGEGQLGDNLTLHHFQLGALFHNVQGCTEGAPIKKPIMVIFRSSHSRQSKLCLRFKVIWKCSLLPLWTFDIVRKDYSVGVNQNHKKKKKKKKKNTLPLN